MNTAGNGWISLHRRIQDHWIWKDSEKLKRWIDILLTVNHSDSKVNLGMEIYECKRGQSVMSLGNWAKRWGVTKDTARNFLSLLERDGMILRESLGKTTRVTVCNYEDYQTSLHVSRTPAVRTLYTNNNDNKNNKKTGSNEPNELYKEVKV